MYLHVSNYVIKLGVSLFVSIFEAIIYKLTFFFFVSSVRLLFTPICRNRSMGLESSSAHSRTSLAGEASVGFHQVV